MVATILAVLRGLGSLAVTLVVVLVAVAKFSDTKSIFRCEGELTIRAGQGQKKPATVFMTLTEYRWWVKLWGGESDGNVIIEAPAEGIYQYFGDLRKVGDSTRHIYDSFGGLKGAYYKVSQYLSVDTSSGFFDGDCVPKD